MLNVVRWGVVLVSGMALFGGCSKESQQKTEVPQTAPASAPPQVPPVQARTGEALFKQHCAVCHPDGGNIVKPDHTLHKKDLAEHEITKPEDIVKIMRNPDKGMTRFDETTLPDKDAIAIAQYVLNSFK